MTVWKRRPGQLARVGVSTVRLTLQESLIGTLPKREGKREVEAHYHALGIPLPDASTRVVTHARSPCRIVEKRAERARKSRAVALRNDAAVDAVLNQAARRGADCIGGDDRHALIEGFVHDESPCLLVSERRDRREHVDPRKGVVRDSPGGRDVTRKAHAVGSPTLARQLRQALAL